MRPRFSSAQLMWGTVGSFVLTLGSYAAYGTAVSDSPWWEVIATLIMQFEPPWFDVGDRLPRIASALLFWMGLVSFVALGFLAVARASEPERDQL